ncbi:MAG: acyltransferase [Cyclobacteriaceae bacterium]|nr:acyltransferase [Cyclobacteriaceae bacterium]
MIKAMIDKTRAPDSYISIGKGCLILGYISLETNEARIEIGDNVYIGQNTMIVCSKEIKIQSDILISSDCIIQDSDNHSIDFETRKNDVANWKKGIHDWSKHPSIPIHLLSGCWIGAKAIILKGVTIGERSIIGAGSVVTKSVSDYTIAAGNPARFIKKIEK